MGVLYNSRIVTDGLVLCLDAGDKMSYPGAGTTWTDLSKHGNNGTINNSPNITDKAITLDSTDDYIEIASVIQASTIDFWFNSPSNQNAPLIYAGNDAFSSSQWQWSLFYYSSTLYWRQDAGDYGQNITSYHSINKWHHFVMTRAATGKVYIDGNHVSSQASTPPSVTGNIRIGKAGNYYWNGSVSSLKLYDRALSAEEIKQNYKATKGRFGL